LKPEIALPDSSSSSSLSSSSSSSSSSPQPPQKQNDENNNSNDDDLNLPPPPLPGHGASYATVKRQGTVDDEQQRHQHMNLVSLGGRPRSVDMDGDANQQRRHRRSAVEPPELDVNTSRVIQVVAPGDVNFALNVPVASTNGTGNGGGADTVVVSTRSGVLSADNVCISVPSFVAGLAMLLSVLVVACLVVTFLFLRVRSMNGAKNCAVSAGVPQGPYMHGAAFEAAEFVKMASS